MKYTLETHGWTVDASCHSLTDEQVSKIQEIMTENGYDELWEMRNEIEENLDINIFEPNMFQVSKGIHNNSLYFYITPPKNPQIFSLWDERWFLILDFFTTSFTF